MEETDVKVENKYFNPARHNYAISSPKVNWKCTKIYSGILSYIFELAKKAGKGKNKKKIENPEQAFYKLHFFSYALDAVKFN